MINKKRFNVKKVKKVLHKVGKYWAVISTAILGLFTGGTMVANNAHANVQNNQNSNQTNHDTYSEQQNSKTKLISAQPTMPQSSAAKASSSATSVANRASLKSGIKNIFSNTVYHGLMSTSTSNAANSASNGSGTVAKAHLVHAQASQASAVDKIMLGAAPAANDQSRQLLPQEHVAKLLTLDNFVNVLNEDVKPTSDSATHAAASNAYNDLMSLANDVADSGFSTDMKVGNLSSSNTWLGDLSRVASDIDAIKANGNDPLVSSAADTLNSATSKVSSKFAAMDQDLIWGPYEINGIETISDNASYITNAIVGSGSTGNGFTGLLNGKLGSKVAAEIAAGRVSRPEIDKLVTMARGVNSIIANPTMKNDYQNVISAAANLPNDNEAQSEDAFLNIDNGIQGIASGLDANPTIASDLSAVGNQADSLASSASAVLSASIASSEASVAKSAASDASSHDKSASNDANNASSGANSASDAAKSASSHDKSASTDASNASNDADSASDAAKSASADNNQASNKAQSASTNASNASNAAANASNAAGSADNDASGARNASASASNDASGVASNSASVSAEASTESSAINSYAMKASAEESSVDSIYRQVKSNNASINGYYTSVASSAAAAASTAGQAVKRITSDQQLINSVLEYPNEAERLNAEIETWNASAQSTSSAVSSMSAEINSLSSAVNYYESNAANASNAPVAHDVFNGLASSANSKINSLSSEIKAMNASFADNNGSSAASVASGASNDNSLIPQSYIPLTSDSSSSAQSSSNAVSPWVASLVTSLETPPSVAKPSYASAPVVQRSAASASVDHVSDVNRLKIGQRAVYHHMMVTREAPQYRDFEVIEPCLAHDTLDSVGEVKDYEMILYPGDDVRFDKIFKVQSGDDSLYRYEIHFQGHNYFVTGNYKFTRNASYGLQDLKHHRVHGRSGHRYYRAVVNEPTFIYSSPSFTKDNQIFKAKRGQRIRIKGVRKSGRTVSFALTNGTFITASREYIKLI